MLTLQDVDEWLSEKIVEFFNFQKLLATENEQRKNRKQNLFAVLNAKLKFWEKYGDTAELFPQEVKLEEKIAEEKDKVGFLKFTDKEILKMPTRFRKTFRAEGCLVCVRRRKRGRNGYDYEARYRRNGLNISVSSKNKDDLVPKFIAALHKQENKQQAVSVPTTFAEFADYFLETFWKRTVAARTFKTEFARYNNHIKPYFGSIELTKITPAACQNLLDSILSEGHGKTADEVKSRLNGIFEAAINHSILTKNPLKLVVYSQHERKTGIALTKEEEKMLLELSKGTPFHLMFAVVLYTGLRPNEYKTARIEGKFIVAVNSKRKNGKVEYKKIPITPMLRSYLNGVTELKFYVPQRIREKLRALLPRHTLKDLRKTFNTRCVECHIADIARKLFMGHSLGKLDNTYTQVSNDYLLSEGEKLNY